MLDVLLLEVLLMLLRRSVVCCLLDCWSRQSLVSKPPVLADTPRRVWALATNRKKWLG
jgi:hypothetical protein